MNPQQNAPTPPEQVPNQQVPDPQPAQTFVHITRAVEPEKPVVSPEIQKRHDQSVQDFPLLNLSESEFVITAVRRHPIGLIIPLTAGTLLIAAALTLLTGYEEIAATLMLTGPLASASIMLVPLLVFIFIVGFSMFVVWYVYVNNKFFLTNESVIQEIQISLFSRLEQTVSLANIEDSSFTQRGIFQHIFDYGDIRLSTEGDETTYRFSYVASPKQHVAELNNAVEAFKNGRPVGLDTPGPNDD